MQSLCRTRLLCLSIALILGLVFWDGWASREAHHLPISERELSYRLSKRRAEAMVALRPYRPMHTLVSTSLTAWDPMSWYRDKKESGIGTLFRVFSFGFSPGDLESLLVGTAVPQKRLGITSRDQVSIEHPG